ncbi:dehydrogenase [Penicillium lividum]|nr:dehydrogenase [Penicillium lividum]
MTGAPSGQGRVNSIALACQGAKLCILDINDSQKVINEMEANSSEAIGFKVNVTDSPEIEAAVQINKDKFGRVDGAGNLAGWIGTEGFLGKGYALNAITDEQ